MPAERVAMRQVREIIRLKFSAGISTREIARRLGRRGQHGQNEADQRDQRANLAAIIR